MNGAQIALGILIVVLIAAGTVLLVAGLALAGWMNLALGWFGFMVMLGMVLSDVQRPKV